MPNPTNAIIYAMLGSRLFLFLFFQFLIALYVKSWDISVKYWLVTATLTNSVTIILLFHLFRKEGYCFFNLFSFNRLSFKKDILLFFGLALLTVPLVLIPGYFTSLWIWGDPDVPTNMMFYDLNMWLIYFLLMAFPVTIAFAELTNYFMYVMPRLKENFKIKWLAALLPILFLSIQHCTLPFIPDMKFILYRGLVFLPFAILLGISIYHRPSLFIYFAILHGIMDFGTVLMFLRVPN